MNLFTYAVLRLTPRALSSGSKSWSYLRKGTAAHVATASILEPYGTVAEQFYASRNTFPTRDGGYHVTRPLCHDKWSKGKDGFLVTDLWGMEASTSVPVTPTVFLRQTEESMYICCHQHKTLTVLLLVPVSSMLNGEQGVSVLKQQLLENVSSSNLFLKY